MDPYRNGTFDQQQNITRPNVTDERKRPNASERRKAVIHDIIAANSAILSQSEINVIHQMFAVDVPNQPAGYRKNPFKLTTAQYANRATVGTTVDITLREFFKKSSRNFNDESQNTFRKGRSPVDHEIRERSSFTSEVSRSHTEISRRSPLNYDRNLLQRETRGASPFGDERSRLKYETRGRSPLTHERRRLPRETRSRSPSINTRNMRHRDTHRSVFNRLGSPTEWNSSYSRRDATNVDHERSRVFLEEHIGGDIHKHNYQNYGDELYREKAHYLDQNIAAASTNEYTHISNVSETEINYPIYSNAHLMRDHVDKSNACRSVGEMGNDLIEAFVVPVKYPDKMMYRFESEKVKKSIRKYLNRCVRLRGMQGLEIPSTAFDRGALLVMCKGEYTKTWLESLVPKLQGAKKRRLKVIYSQDVLPILPVEIKMWLPKKIATTGQQNTVLKNLQSENPGLITKHWQISTIMKTSNGTCLVLKIRQEDVDSLQKYHMRPHLGGGKVVVRVEKKQN